MMSSALLTGEAYCIDVFDEDLRQTSEHECGYRLRLVSCRG